MGRKIKISESRLISMIEGIIKENASAAGFGYGFVKEADVTQTQTAVQSAKDRELSWGKLRQLLKTFYTDYKNVFADVAPNEFNEIEMILNGVISLAREKNINGKDPDVISQYLKQHMRRVMVDDPSIQADIDVEKGEAPAGLKKDSEVKKMFENRLRRRALRESREGKMVEGRTANEFLNKLKREIGKRNVSQDEWRSVVRAVKDFTQGITTADEGGQGCSNCPRIGQPLICFLGTCVHGKEGGGLGWPIPW